MIIKYQQGGGLPPFADYTPLNLPYVDPFQATEASSNKSGSSGEDLGLKDLLSLLKDIDGLPNDAAFMTQQINSLLERASVFPLKSSDIASAYSQIFLSLQNAKHHKSEYDKAQNEAQSRGALSEVAITSNGLLAVYDTENDKITTASIEQVRQSETLQPLTNSDLLNMNSHNSQYTFDISLLDVVENGIGMTEIDKYIREATQSLGTTEISQGGYSVQDQQDIIAGLNVLKEHRHGMPLSGLYKNEIINKNQAAQAQKALQYVYSILPNNAKTLLKYKTGSVEGSLELIQSYIQAQQSGTSSFDTEYVMDLYGNKPGSSNTPKEDSMKITAPMAFLNRMGPSYYTEINPGTSFAFRVTEYKGTITKDNSSLKASSSLLDVIGSDFSPLLDIHNISFGGVKVQADQGGLVIVPSANIYDVELPINTNPSSLGLISPDILLTKRMEEADNEIKLQSITDKNKINEIYMKHALPPKYDSEGNLNKLRYARFARIPVVLTEEALDKKVKVDGTVSKVEDKNRRNGIERSIQETYTKYNLGEGFWGIGKDTVYEGQIYIPIINDSNNSLIITKQYPEVGKVSAVDLQEQDYNRQKASTYNNAGGLAIHMQ